MMMMMIPTMAMLLLTMTYLWGCPSSPSGDPHLRFSTSWPGSQQASVTFERKNIFFRPGALVETSDGRTWLVKFKKGSAENGEEEELNWGGSSRDYRWSFPNVNSIFSVVLVDHHKPNKKLNPQVVPGPSGFLGGLRGVCTWGLGLIKIFNFKLLEKISVPCIYHFWVGFNSILRYC